MSFKSPVMTDCLTLKLKRHFLLLGQKAYDHEFNKREHALVVRFEHCLIEYRIVNCSHVACIEFDIELPGNVLLPLNVYL